VRVKENVNINLVIEQMSDWLDEHLGNSQFANQVLIWQGMLMGIDDLTAYPSPNNNVFEDLYNDDEDNNNE